LFDEYAYIRKLAVSPEDCNQGIGSALLQYAMDDIREAGKPKAAICPSNNDNGRLYARLGFAQDLNFTGISSWLFKDLLPPDPV
jgi:ribosomal protein S18 acetylase RimI-like enzyme